MTHKIVKATFLLFVVTITIQHIAWSQDSKKDKEAAEAAAIKKMVDSKKYVFEVQSVTPQGGRTRQLSYGFTLKVSNDTLVSNLPYFGQAYTPSINPNDGGINFTSTDFEYTVAENKKGGWDITIKPKDKNDVQQLFLTIFDNGTSSLRVTSNSRQAISYRGYIDQGK